MKPNEKAKELVDKFKEHCESDWFSARYSEYKSVEEVILLEAKQCALICVEEIIKENLLLVEDKMIEFVSLCKLVERNNYWKKVKQEIEKIN